MRKSDFEELKASLGEAVAHAKGEAAGGVRVHQVDVELIDVAALRKRMNLTQAAFSEMIETPIATLRKWEQRTRRPTWPARALLRIIERAPDAVRAALADRTVPGTAKPQSTAKARRQPVL